MFTTYAGGAQTHTETVSLPFDPAAGFHEYRFDYLCEPGIGHATIAFYVDSRKKTKYTCVDSITYSVQP